MNDNQGFNGEYDAPYIRHIALILVVSIIGLFVLASIL